MLRLTAATWSGTYAWMVDKNGNAVPVDNHVQKGEDIESQLDEYGIACALNYAKKTRSQDYWEAACILAQYDVFTALSWDEPDDVIDIEDELTWLLEPQNIPIYKEALQLPSFKLTGDEIEELYVGRELSRKVPAARKTLHTLFERLMMRVRVGGVINTTQRSTADIYFRIPDSQANGWYTAIGNFLYDYPQYAGFRIHIYEEADTAGERRELEVYDDSKEFLDIHASVKTRDAFKFQRLDSAYRRRVVLNNQFIEAMRSK